MPARPRVLLVALALASSGCGLLLDGEFPIVFDATVRDAPDAGDVSDASDGADAPDASDGADAPDASMDAPPDHGLDASLDAVDERADAPAEAATDAPRDVGLDVPRDVGLDVGLDAPRDVPRDVTEDAPRDVAEDAVRDAAGATCVVDSDCETGLACCASSGRCYDPRCLACCMPVVETDAGPPPPSCATLGLTCLLSGTLFGTCCNCGPGRLLCLNLLGGRCADRCPP